MGQHGVVLVFVVELQDLNEVVEASLVLGVLAGLVHGEHVGLGEGLLTLFRLPSDLLNGLYCGVQVASPDKVPDIECIDFAISLEVVDVKSKVDS